ncbi:MAG TPA: DUF2785 domain-containing protein [Gemmatimonadaceae bacterium]|nr:DUF2785 domain-containing protein [Gemmatimonadaceae bacterium]
MSLATGTTTPSPAGCPPDGWSTTSLEALKARHWKLDDTPRREALSKSLLPCLASADPALRDGVAFEALSAWMRADLLGQPVLRDIAGMLVAELASTRPDTAGFRQPFAALVLSEVARVDRLRAFFSAGERATLLQAAVTWLPTVRDYRGFDTRDGWRHGVAHGADLLMQLALNPAFGLPEHERILDAVATQVAPPGEHFYVYGEGERLARPVLFVARRGTVAAEFWNGWIQRLATPGQFKDWESALQTQAGLARRNNLNGFLASLYINIAGGSDENAKRALLPAVTEALRALN